MPSLPGRRAARGPGRKAAGILLALCLILHLKPRAAEEPLLPGEAGSTSNARYTLLEAGTALGVGGDLGFLPQVGAFFDQPGQWQLGAQARMALTAADRAYDYLPHAALTVRKLWLGDENTAAIRNSEYFGISLGGYFAYDFEGNEDGIRPFGSVSLGKYWMPLEGRSLGLDLSLDLTTLKIPFLPSGHLPSHSEVVFITIGANVFYAIP